MTKYTDKELAREAREAIKSQAKREGFRAKYRGFTLILNGPDVYLQARGEKVSKYGVVLSDDPTAFAFVSNVAI